MKATKFTFKTEKATGKYRSFSSDTHSIKLNGCEVGTIDDEQPHKIRLMVIKKDIMEDGNKNCPWKWTRLKAEFETVQEAKDYLNEKFDVIMKQFPLFLER